MSKKKAIGIDLGTSKCCVGVVRDGKVEILENERGKKTTPSYVAFTDTERLVGDDAKDQATVNPDNTVSGVKRFMCKAMNENAKMTPINATINEKGETCFQVTYKKIKQTLLPQQISAMLLTKMKTLVEDHLKSSVEEAVISVPASFSNAQRQATKDAAAIAGLKVLALMNEPTAAAIAYQVNRRSKGIETIAVVDFGAGKLDVSIVTMDDGNICVNGVSGTTDIGGNDVDEMLMSRIINKYREDNSNQDPPQGSRVMDRLRSSCENIKRKFTLLPKVQETLDCFGEDKILRFTMHRDEFNDMLEAKIYKCLIGCLTDSFKAAKIDQKVISRVLLVGGSTRMIVFQEWLQKLFECPIDRSVNPDEAVASGASVQAALLSRDHEVKELIIQGGIGTNLYLMKDGDSHPMAIFGLDFFVAAPSGECIPAPSMKQKCTYHVCEEVLGKKDSFCLIITFCYSSDLRLFVDKSGIFRVFEYVGPNADGSYKWMEIQNNIKGKLDGVNLKKLVEQEKKFQKDDQEEKSRTEAMADLESLCFQYQSDLEKHQVTESSSELIQKLAKEVKKTINWLSSAETVSKTECHERKAFLEQENKNVRLEREKERVEAVKKLIMYSLELPFTVNESDETVKQLRLSDTLKDLHEKIVKWAVPNSTLSKEECDNYITTLENKFDKNTEREKETKATAIDMRQECTSNDVVPVGSTVNSECPEDSEGSSSASNPIFQGVAGDKNGKTSQSENQLSQCQPGSREVQEINSEQ